jgi:hypothetical protein
LGSALDSAAAQPEVKPEHLHAMADKLEGAQHQANAKQIMSQAQDAYASAVGAPQAEEEDEEEDDPNDDLDTALSKIEARHPEPKKEPKDYNESHNVERFFTNVHGHGVKRRTYKAMMKDPLQDELREASKVDKFYESDGDGDPLGDVLEIVSKAIVHGEDGKFTSGGGLDSIKPGGPERRKYLKEHPDEAKAYQKKAKDYLESRGHKFEEGKLHAMTEGEFRADDFARSRGRAPRVTPPKVDKSDDPLGKVLKSL